MLHSVDNTNTAFKSGPWYANLITNATRVDAFGPIVALEATVDTGRAANAYNRGGKNEARERLIEDLTGAVVWLYGVKSLNAIGDKILNKLYGGTFDVGTDKVLRTPFENFMKKNANKPFAANKKKVALVKAAKVLTSIILADSFIGLVVPKCNQKLTRMFIAKDKEKAQKELQNNSNIEKEKTSAGNVQFKGLGFSGINVFTNAIENTNIGKLISTDAGLISGRMYSARNNDERREIAIRDIGSIYFYLLASSHVGNLLNFAESGRFTRLNPDSANILNEHLTRFLESKGGAMSAEEFEKMVLGSINQNLPKNINFECGELSTFDKLFHKNKEPLKVAKVEQLEKIKEFTPEVIERIKEMSKLQPLRQGEAVVTKQQIIDAMNIAEINDPKLLDKIFTTYTKGDHKNEFKYISNNKLYNLKSEMEAYVKDICKGVKGNKITKDVLNKAKKNNLIYSGINFASGFAVAALFLSMLIPKFQYWVTRRKTGMNAFPGTYEFDDAKKEKVK